MLPKMLLILPKKKKKKVSALPRANYQSIWCWDGNSPRNLLATSGVWIVALKWIGWHMKYILKGHITFTFLSQWPIGNSCHSTSTSFLLHGQGLWHIEAPHWCNSSMQSSSRSTSPIFSPGGTSLSEKSVRRASTGGTPPILKRAWMLYNETFLTSCSWWNEEGLQALLGRPMCWDQWIRCPAAVWLA